MIREVSGGVLQTNFPCGGKWSVRPLEFEKGATRDARLTVQIESLTEALMMHAHHAPQ